MGYKLDDQGLISGRGLGFLSPCQHVQTDPGAHPATYLMGSGGSFLIGKVAGV
jgi:hypothetical protein